MIKGILSYVSDMTYTRHLSTFHLCLSMPVCLRLSSMDDARYFEDFAVHLTENNHMI